MAIPKYNDLFQPVLEAIVDGKEYKVSNLVDILADKIGLSDEEKSELLPSGTDYVFKNRVWWARSFLFKAELISSPQRGYIQISDLGKKFLKEGVAIDLVFLRSLPHFEGNWGNKEGRSDKELASVVEEKLTPEEMIEDGHKRIKYGLVQEILEQVKNNVSPANFEQLVVNLLIKMGYGGSRKDAGIAVGKSGDGGIDGLINEDRLGLSKIYLQAKHWEANVGDVEIGRFLGSLASRGATKGVFITTSDFTSQARNTIANNKSSVEIVLINGHLLADLMIEYNLGVTTVNSYEVKRIDSEYFL